MSMLTLSLILFLVFVLCLLISNLASFFISKKAWIAPVKFLQKTFADDFNLQKLSFFFKENRVLYLSFILLFQIINFVIFIVFLWVIIIGYQNNGTSIYYIVPFIVVYILSFIPLYIFIKLLFWHFYMSGWTEKTLGIEKFVNYQTKIAAAHAHKEHSINVFERNGAISLFQKSITHFQNRFKRKVKQLKTKKTKTKYYELKLLKLYFKYVKGIAYYYSNLNTKKNYLEINEKKYDTIEPLKDMLIDNFFVWAKHRINS